MNSAVLFLVFNRPDLAEKVFSQLREVQVPRLYIACDGPRPGKVEDVGAVAKCRSFAQNVDWPCEVFTLFREKNLGCKKGVSAALDWFFEQEEEGIILEDDCVPDPSFFRFCDEMLELYRRDEKVAAISGSNFFCRSRNAITDGYYFSKYFHCWGWAVWRRSWVLYRPSLNGWPKWHASADYRKWLTSGAEQNYWKNIFDDCYGGVRDSWAYPFMASIWMESRFTIQPSVNLVENIGFGEGATHTNSATPCPGACSLQFPIRPLNRIGKTKAIDQLVFRSHFQRKLAQAKTPFSLRGTARKAVRSLPKSLSDAIYFSVSKSFRRERREMKDFESLRAGIRFLPGEINFEGRHWHYADAPSFYHAYKAIYWRRCFSFRFDSDCPRLIDAGANVGMVTRFWKEEFPNAEIVVIEADEDLIPLIERNLNGFGEPKAEIRNAALWIDAYGVQFEVQGADAGHVLSGKFSKGFHRNVPSVSLVEVIDERKVDFLKMDIEGAEGEVLKAGKAALRWVDRIFIEYHSRPGSPQELGEFFSILEEAGFRLWMDSEYVPKHPYMRRTLSQGMDLQLNVCGVKKDLL